MTPVLFKGVDLKEGDIFCKWLRAKLIEKNQNVLGVEVGSTGSGKSYRDLRKAELWYKFQFNESFPVENICFGLLTIMERISSGELRRGDILILEEAGVNLGNLDFQNRIAKMFTYVLQSFRSMNIGIFFNLPYFSMLNKSARMLMHYSAESVGVDYKKKQNKCKLFFHQTNQKTGKIYQKFPKVFVSGKVKKIQRVNYNLPSQYLIDAYESKKNEFLTETTKKYTEEMRKLKEKDSPKKKELLPHQLEVYKLNQKGLTQSEIGEKTNKSQESVHSMLKTIEKYGYPVKKRHIKQKSLEN